MQCPQCKNEVPVTNMNYGTLFTCPKCMAVYFVNFDGQPEYGDMEIPAADYSTENVNLVEAVDLTDSDNSNVLSFSVEPNSDTFLDPLLDTLSDSSDSPLTTLPDDLNQFTTDTSAFGLAAQEISDYGNQEEIISNISYDVLIKGLDTKEVMQEFKDAIDDSKFSWITQDVLNQIKNGESKLVNLNPIQAYVLANRIQFLNLEIEWKQNVAF